MPESDITKRPKRKASDFAHTLVKAGLSAVPIVGSSANELLSLVITPSLEKRRDKWIESIVKDLKALEAKVEGFKIENLCENEMFISTVMQASQVAFRTHQKEKLEALKNVVLNAALPNAPEEDLQLMFLNFVDSFTPSHLKILKTLNSRESSCTTNLKTFVGNDFTEIKNHPAFDQIVKDLESRGLVPILPTPGIISFTKGRNKITDLGKKFLKFVMSPIERNNSHQY